MSFQINPEEFETTEEVRQSSIRYEVMETLQKIGYLENRYEQKLISVENRKKNLLWTIGIRVLVAIGFGVLAVIFNIFSHPAFAITSIGVCMIAAAIAMFDAIRVVLSYCTHMEFFSAPIWLVKNKVKQISGYATIQTGHGLYTLKQEGKDCLQLQKQLQRDKQTLKRFLEQEQTTEEEGRELLDGIVPTLEEMDTRAVLLYGERI